MSQEVFISYSSKDAAAAVAIVAALEGAGITCWYAPRNITAGSEWSTAIIGALNACRTVVLLFSGASNASPQVLREVERAVHLRVPIITVRLEDVPLTPAMEYFISVAHWFDATGQELQQHLPAVVAAAREALRQGEAPDSGSGEIAAVEASTAPSPSVATPPPNNLPQRMAAFIGREKERSEILKHLDEQRLVTLVGVGGFGKTRLSVEIAGDVLGKGMTPEGAWLVELAPVAQSELVTQTIAAALDVREDASKNLLQVLTDYLKPKRVLLLLDNCEHLISECARLTEKLLHACPNLRILATSREAININGETVYRLPPLSIPPANSHHSAESVLSFDSVRLFASRAKASQSSFEVTDDNAESVAQVCLYLDGIPLALELAAARVRSLPIEQLATRLSDRFRLLTGGSRTALPRQQTLRATIDWSYDLLDPRERTLLRRLSVFSGGWALEAAEAICATDPASDSDPAEVIEDWEVLDLLSALVDKSLAVFDDQNGTSRYGLLTTIQQYALERIQESGELEAISNRHAEFYCRIADEASNASSKKDQAARLDQLQGDHDNLRAAMDWLLSNDRLATAAVMAMSLKTFWWKRGRIQEGRSALGRILERIAELDENCRAGVLSAAGWLAYLQADYDSAQKWQSSSLELCRVLADAPGEADALNNLALVAQVQGRLDEATELFQSSLLIAQKLGDDAKVAARLSNIGLLAVHQGRYDDARLRLCEARAVYESRNDQEGAAACLCNLSELELRQQNWDEADSMAQESLTLFSKINDKPGIAYSLTNLAEASLNRESYEAGERYTRQALALCTNSGIYGLLPTIMEIRARVFAGSGHIGNGFVCIAAADRLRGELKSPRSPQEQTEIEGVRAAFAGAEGDAVAAAARIMALPLKEIVGRVLSFKVTDLS